MSFKRNEDQYAFRLNFHLQGEVLSCQLNSRISVLRLIFLWQQTLVAVQMRPLGLNFSQVRRATLSSLSWRKTIDIAEYDERESSRRVDQVDHKCFYNDTPVDSLRSL